MEEKLGEDHRRWWERRGNSEQRKKSFYVQTEWRTGTKLVNTHRTHKLWTHTPVLQRTRNHTDTCTHLHKKHTQLEREPKPRAQTEPPRVPLSHACTHMALIPYAKLALNSWLHSGCTHSPRSSPALTARNAGLQQEVGQNLLISKTFWIPAQEEETSCGILLVLLGARKKTETLTVINSKIRLITWANVTVFITGL